MCLSTITEQPPKRTSGVGYKVFVKESWGLRTWLRGRLRRPIVAGEWLDETNYRSPNDFTPREGFGWHIFTRKSDAMAMRYRHIHSSRRLYKVRYRGATVRGLWMGRPNVVAKEIFVMEEI